MPKLPKGFGATLKRLYREGANRQQAFQEAWRIHGKRPHKKIVKTKPWKYNPKRKNPPLIAEVYHGYYIRSNHVGDIWIEKNAKFIGYAKSLADAKRIIDQDLPPERRNPKRKPRKTCPQCGTSLKGSARVCPHCITKQNPTRMQLQNYFDKTHGTLRVRINATEKAFDVSDIKVNRQGTIVFFKKNNPRKRNPIAIYNPAKGAKLLYGKARIPKIYGMKTQGEFKGQKFIHNSSHDVSIYGLPNGDLLVKGHNMRLWANDQDIDRYEKR